MIPRSLALPAALLMTGALATPALAATQTLAFTAVQFSSSGPVTKYRDVNANAEIIGHDVLICKPPSKHAVTCTGVLTFTAPKKGSISVKVKIDLDAKIGMGPITGGTGAYAGAKGAIKGTATSRNGRTVEIFLTITQRHRPDPPTVS